MKSKIEELSRKVDTLHNRYEYVKELLKQGERKLQELQNKMEDTKVAQAIVQVVTEDIQNKIHSKISEIVSMCLNSIMEDPYEFKIIFEKKRGKTEARIQLERNGVIEDPIDSCGGGVIDIISFALRISCIILTNPQVRKIVIMDEPFKWVSSNLIDKVVCLLKKLSEDCGLQFIVVTHNQSLQIGKIIEL